MSNTNQILRKQQVCERTGLPASTLYQKIKDGKFPRQIKLGARSSGWVESEVKQWIDAQIAARNTK